MSRISEYVCLCAAAILCAIGFRSVVQFGETDERPVQTIDPGLPYYAGCTIFMTAIGDEVLFGNNVDDGNPNTFYTISPAVEEGKLGVLYLGFSEPQGGINEAGLAFDTNGLWPPEPLNLHRERKSIPGGPVAIVMEIMGMAETVDEVIALAQQYDWGEALNDQWFFADAGGDAVVISAGSNGELAFTRKSDERFLVSTNFNRSLPRVDGISRRFDTTTRMLRRVSDRGEVTVESFVKILDAVHQEGGELREDVYLETRYSNIFDLKKGKIYLYYWQQFGMGIELDVNQELLKGPGRVRVFELFPTKTVVAAETEYQAEVRRRALRNSVALVWIALSVLFLLFTLIDLVRKRTFGIPRWILPLAAILLFPATAPIYLCARSSRRFAATRFYQVTSHALSTTIPHVLLGFLFLALYLELKQHTGAIVGLFGYFAFPVMILWGVTKNRSLSAELRIGLPILLVFLLSFTTALRWFPEIDPSQPLFWLCYEGSAIVAFTTAATIAGLARIITRR